MSPPVSEGLHTSSDVDVKDIISVVPSFVDPTHCRLVSAEDIFYVKWFDAETRLRGGEAKREGEFKKVATEKLTAHNTNG